MQKANATLCAILVSACGASGQWKTNDPGPGPNWPTARGRVAMCYDLARGNTVMFGGRDSFARPVLDETWTFDGTNWTRVFPPFAPSRREWSRMVFDRSRGVVVLFGGTSGGDEHWEWDGSNWSQRLPTVTPPPRGRHGMVYDESRQRVVIFGGVPGATGVGPTKDDTWEYDAVANTWIPFAPAQKPPPRKAHAMCYHAGSGKIVVFGGYGNTGVYDDTWTFDGTNWTQVATGVRPPALGRGFMVYDPVRDMCVLHGGQDVGPKVLSDTWEFDGTQWALASSSGPPRLGYGMAMDLLRSRLVIFGGFDNDISNNFSSGLGEYGTDADYRTFGVGCQGTNGIPTLSNGSLPRLGSTLTLNVTNLETSASTAFMVFGGIALPQPLDLSGIGAPGCKLFISSDIILSIPASNGSASTSVPLPAAGWLFGFEMHNQAVSLDLAANRLGLTLSNAGTAILGT